MCWINWESVVASAFGGRFKDSRISYFGILSVWSNGIGLWFCLFFLKRIKHFVSRRGPKRRITPKGHMNKWLLLYFPCHRRIKSWVIIAAHLEFVACAFLMELERKELH